jgi:DnaJ-class molecular chaperone
MEDKGLVVRCEKCEGFGLQEKTIISPCSKCPGKDGCMYCQNKNRGMYEECNKCRGAGELLKVASDVPQHQSEKRINPVSSFP